MFNMPSSYHASPNYDRLTQVSLGALRVEKKGERGVARYIPNYLHVHVSSLQQKKNYQKTGSNSCALINRMPYHQPMMDQFISRTSVVISEHVSCITKLYLEEHHHGQFGWK